jgi:hypothetical protein
MTDVKVGDWVWADGRAHKVIEIDVGKNIFVKDSKAAYPPSDVRYPYGYTVLKPYASIDEARIGDRAVFLLGGILGISEGFMTEILGVDLEEGLVVFNDDEGDLRTWRPRWLAPVPRDVPRVDEPNVEELAIEIRKNLTILPGFVNTFWSKVESMPCPHPELLGVWGYCGKVYHVTWDGARFRAKDIHENRVVTVEKLDLTECGWTPIEPAPDRSIAYPAQRRTGDKNRARHDYIKVPWDPYQEG